MEERRRKLIVVGNGMAGVRLLEELMKLEPERYEIAVYGSEPVPAYNRILLSKVLQGDTPMEEITLKPADWYEERGIRLFTGETVEAIDAPNRTIRTSAGRTDRYDRLVLATGSSAFIPSIPGADKKGVIAFRTIADCESMLKASRESKRAAVIGGGLLGLEAARGLLNLGMEAHVVHNAAHLMNRQLDPMASLLLRRELERQGMEFHLGKETLQVTGLSRANGLRFRDGGVLKADLILFAIGIRPRIELAKLAGLNAARAIVVDDSMRTSDPHIFAVGECAEHRGVVYGLVAPLYEQAKTLAATLAGAEGQQYEGSVPYSQLKVSGAEVFSVGDVSGHGEEETLLQQFDGLKGTYRRVFGRGGVVTGAVLYGDVSDGPELLGLVKKNASIAELEKAFSGGSAAAAPDGLSPREAAAAAMPDSAVVCECNAIAKAEIVRAVSGGCGSADEVRACTGASGSCGGCRPVVESIVKLALSGRNTSEQQPAMLQPAAVPLSRPLPLCGCTELAPAELPQALSRLAEALCPPQEALSRLGWSSRSGCEDCRPALNYYAQRNGWPVIGDAVEWPASQRTLKVRAGRAAAGRLGESREAAVAAELECLWRRLPWPTPLTAAVSSGPHAPAGTLVADIGLSHAPSGWELTAGGSAEGVVRGGQLLAVADTLEEAAEAASACLQLYRSEAFWGEPVWQWLERNGELALRERLADPGRRRSLAERLRLEAEEFTPAERAPAPLRAF